MTGGWPILIERIITRMRQRPFDDAIDEPNAHLATTAGARELVAAVGLDPDDPDQPGDLHLIATLARLAETGWQDLANDLADLLDLDDELAEEDPAEAIAILRLPGALDEDDEGRLGAEATLARCVSRLSSAVAF